jgi:hypothetical protein
MTTFAFMRKQLAAENGTRKKFSATFERVGKKVNYKGYTEETILLKNIVDFETKKVVADHIWFSYTKGFEKLSLTPGVVLEFEARVKEYKKGYVNKALNLHNRSTDYKLSHPTKISAVPAKP